MNDRDCKTCAYHTEEGCTTWDCYYINRQDAIHAYLALRNVELEEEEEYDEL